MDNEQFENTARAYKRNIIKSILQAIRLKKLGYYKDDDGYNSLHNLTDAARLAEQFQSKAMMDGEALLRLHTVNINEDVD